MYRYIYIVENMFEHIYFYPETMIITYIPYISSWSWSVHNKIYLLPTLFSLSFIMIKLHRNINILNFKTQTQCSHLCSNYHQKVSWLLQGNFARS